MKRVYNLVRQEPDERDYKLRAEAAELPKTIDLRNKCPPVFDQGKLGSCTAQAGVGAHMMLNDSDVMKSRLYLYYKERFLDGRTDVDSGSSMRNVGKALQKYGVPSEENYPYLAEKFANTPPSAVDEEAARNRILKYVQLGDVWEIKTYIATRHQPVMIGMEVYPSFERVGKSGIVPMPGRENPLGGHAILIVGYDDNLIKKAGFFRSLFALISSGEYCETGYLICRNSWGEKWGNKGYFYLPYSFVREGYAFDAWVIE